MEFEEVKHLYPILPETAPEGDVHIVEGSANLYLQTISEIQEEIKREKRCFEQKIS